jgi:hypothetical protein
VGRDVRDLIIPQRFRRAHAEGLRRAVERGTAGGRRLEVTAMDRNGREFAVELAVKAAVEYGSPVFHAFLHDITARRKAEVTRAAQHAVAQVLAEAPGSQEAATGVVAAVTNALDWRCGEYWKVDPDQRSITRTGSWRKADHDMSAFTGPEPVIFRHGQGLAGLVWESGHRDVVVQRAQADPQQLGDRGDRAGGVGRADGEGPDRDRGAALPGAPVGTDHESAVTGVVAVDQPVRRLQAVEVRRAGQRDRLPGDAAVGRLDQP